MLKILKTDAINELGSAATEKIASVQHFLKHKFGAIEKEQEEAPTNPELERIAEYRLKEVRQTAKILVFPVKHNADASDTVEHKADESDTTELRQQHMSLLLVFIPVALLRKNPYVLGISLLYVGITSLINIQKNSTR